MISTTEPSSYLRDLARLARPYRSHLAFGAAILALESLFALALPYFGGLLAERLLVNRDHAIAFILIALLAVLTAQALLRFANTFVLGRAAHAMLADLRVQLYSHLQRLPLSYFNEGKRGDILSLLITDVGNIGNYLTSTLVGIVSLVLTLLGSMFFMWRIDPTLAMLALAAIPLFYLAIKVLARKVRPLSAELNEAYWQAFSRAEENLGLIAIIKAFSREPYEAKRYEALNAAVKSLENRLLWHSGGLAPAVQWLAGVAVVVVLWFAADKLAAQTLSAGALVSFLLYASLITRPISALADLYGRTQSVRASLARVKTAFDTPTEIGLSENAPSNTQTTANTIQKNTNELFSRSPNLIGPSIVFESISFSYLNRPELLSNWSLTIDAGETIALIGENGAGKSTLIQLLMRYLNPSEGKILIDGVDIATMALPALRKLIGYVPQHVQLANASIRDNIAFGAPDANIDDIVAAAKLAQAHEFVERLPQGYDTIVGDQGVRLSGGQRQRVALARALLVNAPILVLDEATSMFDVAASERLLASQTWLHGRTVIWITHEKGAIEFVSR
ncbi:MAG: ABC transporter ATP-binding protein, partial [Casimicrobium sp.]